MRVRRLLERPFGRVLALVVGALFQLGDLGAVAQGADTPEGAPRVLPGASSGAPAEVPPGMPGLSTSATGAPISPAELARRAQAGDHDAQVKYGNTFLIAKPPNFQEAQRWFRLASDGGNAAGAQNLGMMFENGLGAPKNPTEAARWYRLAAERGNAMGQAQIGRLYESGTGVPQDFGEALKWYRMAADQKNSTGQNNLGSMYVMGRGVAADPAEAVRLFRLAADQGNSVAQANLGFQYVAGRGVAQSDGAAYFWLNLAAARLPANFTALRTRVAQVRDGVARKLAPGELQEMQHLAAAWKPGSAGVPTGGPVAGAGAQVASAAGTAAPGAASKPIGSGTGFVITQSGFVVTNDHVVAPCGQMRARHGAEPLGTLTVIARDAQNDLALLKLASRFPDVAVFREDRAVRQGDSVVIYGFPLIGMLTPQGNLTTGTVSALAGIGNDSRMLQVSAPVQPGNSGGPLLDAGGSVLGVVNMKLNALRTAAATGDIPQNVNFAIKTSVVRNFLDTNGVSYQTTAQLHELKTADVGDRAKKFTLLIECWR